MNFCRNAKRSATGSAARRTGLLGDAQESNLIVALVRRLAGLLPDWFSLLSWIPFNFELRRDGKQVGSYKRILGPLRDRYVLELGARNSARSIAACSSPSPLPWTCSRTANASARDRRLELGQQWRIFPCSARLPKRCRASIRFDRLRARSTSMAPLRSSQRDGSDGPRVDRKPAHASTRATSKYYWQLRAVCSDPEGEVAARPPSRTSRPRGSASAAGRGGNCERGACGEEGAGEE